MSNGALIGGLFGASVALAWAGGYAYTQVNRRVTWGLVLMAIGTSLFAQWLAYVR